MQQAALDACGFVEGLAKDDFLNDKRTQQAVIMSLIIIISNMLSGTDFHKDIAASTICDRDVDISILMSFLALRAGKKPCEVGISS